MGRRIYIYDDMPDEMIPILQEIFDALSAVRSLGIAISDAQRRGDIDAVKQKSIEHQTATELVEELQAQADKIQADLLDEMANQAKAMDISEVATRIPKRLAGIITEEMLPCMYEEPDPAPIEKPILVADEITAIKARLLVVENKPDVDLEPLESQITGLNDRVNTLEGGINDVGLDRP